MKLEAWPSLLVLISGRVLADKEPGEPKSQGRLPLEQCSYTPPGLSRLEEPASCPQPASETIGPRPWSWAPWTHRPFCANTSYCVFTNAAFQGGAGISIVTTPEAASSAQRLLETAFGAAPIFDTVPTPPPWEIKNIPGKGMGVVASRLIPRGEVLMVDYASIVAAVAFPGRVTRAAGKEILPRTADQLPDPERVFGLARSSTRGAPVVEDVLRTNTFSVVLDGVEYMALFPLESRINHACQPNAYMRFSDKTLAQRTIAFRDIEPGEEITISYSAFGMTHKERQTTLRNRWGFTCTCSLCTALPASIAASDARRERAKGLRDTIVARVDRADYGSAIELTRMLMEINEREGLVSHLGDHYEVLSRLYIGARDLVNAEKYARLALHDFRRFGGPDVFESVKELEDVLATMEKKRRR